VCVSVCGNMETASACKRQGMVSLRLFKCSLSVFVRESNREREKGKARASVCVRTHMPGAVLGDFQVPSVCV